MARGRVYTGIVFFSVLLFVLYSFNKSENFAESLISTSKNTEQIGNESVAFIETIPNQGFMPMQGESFAEGEIPAGGEEVATEIIQVKSFYGPYSVENKKSGVPAPSLGLPKFESWSPPEKASRPYRIAVLFPHLKDPFWIAVNYGVVMEAKKYGIQINLWHAGGYRNLGKQALQLKYILQNKDKFDGIIIGAVQYKKSKLEKLYQQLDEAEIPIISVVNDSFTPGIKAKALVSFRELGYQAALHMLQDADQQPAKVLFMPGPKGTGWAPDTFEGFKTALLNNKSENVQLLEPIWGDTGEKTQQHLLEYILPRTENIDYLVANAIAVDAMLSSVNNNGQTLIERHRNRHPKLKIISTYLTQNVYDHIVSGNVLASPTDLMKQQGMIAVDMMIKYLNGERPGSKGFPFRSGPIVPIIDRHNYKQWPFKYVFGTREFKPVFNLIPQNNIE